MKQFFRDRKELNYAYNINNSPNSIKSKKISFNSLSRNFYEDIINSDIRIKNSRHRLSKIKSNSIKESIYSNNIIPSTWKLMFDYRPTIYKAIDKDPTFAFYLGRSQNKDINSKFQHAQQLKSVNDIKTVGQKSMSSFIKNFFIEKKEENVDKTDPTAETRGMEPTSGRGVESENFSGNESKKDIEVEKAERKAKQKKSNIFHAKTGYSEKNMLIDDKLISSKLDEYRTKYDLEKFMKEIKKQKEEDRKKKNINIPILQNIEERENDYMHFLKTRTTSDKEHVLKSSIYYNLIAKHNKEEGKDLNKSKKILKKINLKPLKSENIFLFHNDEFDKVIEITNPKIKRDLELINYYGPLYTHCKLCNNRNLEFYKNSEPNQTLKLLQYLKKIKLGEDKEDNKNNNQN